VRLCVEQVTLQHHYACGQYPGTDRGHSVLCTHEHEQQGLRPSRRHSGAATETWTLLRAVGHESEHTEASTVITNTLPLLVCGLFATTRSSPGARVPCRFAPLSCRRLGLRPLLVRGKDGW
jgi:hypothetical protein